MTNLSLWSARGPFAEFDELVRRAFGSGSDRTAPEWPGRTGGYRPAAEVGRDGDDAVIRIEVPGVDVAKDVTVELDRGRLVVRGERRDDRSEQRGGYGLREVRYGRFERSWTLPEHVTADAISASYDAGVLTVRVAGLHAEVSRDAQRIAVTAAPPAAPAGETDATDEQPSA